MLLIVSIVVFSIIRFIPGDPAETIAGLSATPEYIEQVRERLALNQPIYLQYFAFLRSLFQGDLGESIKHKVPVNTLLFRTFTNTLELSVISLIVAASIGIGLGIVSARYRYSIFDNLSMLAALAGMAMPVFWLGLMLQLFFSVNLGWLPSTGKGTLLQFVMPVMTLGIGSIALLARITRSSMLDVLRKDYIITARAKGLPERVVIFKHALRNALIPVITILGLQLGAMLGGAVVVEIVFAWPGMGRLLVNSILQRDYPVIQGVVLVFASCFILINLVVDLIYACLDPRIRYTSGKEVS
ncbi:MAG: ABC transporter permease [Promethearchaeota archaeon]